MIWLAIWAGGVPIAYTLDNDPTGTWRDKLFGAAMWPLVVLLIAAMLIGGGFFVSINALRKAW